jgi:hypothetical protein
MHIQIEDFKNDLNTWSEAIQTGLDTMVNTERNVTVSFPYGKTLLLDETLYYPKYNDRTIYFEGNGCLLKMKDKTKDILKEGKYFSLEDNEWKPQLKGATVKEALGAIDHIHINKLNFQGGNIAITLAASFLSTITNCKFLSCQISVMGVFALQTKISDCWINVIQKEGVLLRSGEGDAITGDGKYFSNATGSNSQSNICTIENCRIQAGDIGKIGIRAYSSSNLTVRDTVIEGGTFKYAVHFDGRGSTTTVAMHLENLHVEYGGVALDETAIFYVRSCVKVTMNRIYCQYGGVPQVETGSGVQELHLNDWSYFPSGGLKVRSGKVFINNCYNMSETSIQSQEFWNLSDSDPSIIIPWNWAYRLSSPNWKMGHGWGAEINGNDTNLVVGYGRITTSAKQFIFEDIKTLKKGISLDGYEIIQTIPTLLTDENNKSQVVYLPLIRKK